VILPVPILDREPFRPFIDRFSAHSPRDPRLFLADIDTAVGRILEYTAGGEAEFKSSTLIQDAVVRQLEIIGEAARNLDDHLLSQEASIPWSKVVGMRHILAHGYYQIDSGVVWDTVSSDLVELRAAVQRLSRTLE